MRIFFLIIVMVFCSSNVSFAQQKQQLLFKIIDGQSKKTVPYATIRFANSNNGTIANLKGDFRVPIRYKEENDTLIVSCIGYATKSVVLNILIEKDYHIITLQPKIERLNEVVLKSDKQKKMRASEIVERAIKEIKANNPQEPFSYIGYYRDYQIVEGEYINLNEGIVEAFDQGFLSHKISDSLNKTALYSYKPNKEFAQDKLLDKAFYNESKQIKEGEMGSSIGNELTLLNIHDPIRNYNTGSFSFVYTLEKDFVKNHKFFKKKSIYLDNEELYKIEFSAKTDITGYAYRATGFMYISKEDFSIHGFHYKLYSNRMRKSVFNVAIEYKRQDNGKMYLNYITFNNNFFLTLEGALKIENWEYIKEESLFVIEFNRTLDTSDAPKTSDVKIVFSDKKLVVNDVVFSSPKKIKVKLNKESSVFLNEQNLEEKALFTLKLKNFKDAQGFEMGQSKVEGYQYRELFTQEIFTNKEFSLNLHYLNKASPLSDAKINQSNVDINKYWINSPLKQIKKTNR